MDNGKTYTIELQYDTESDDVVLPLPDELVKQAGWELGDELEWIDNGDGSYSLQKHFEPTTEKQWVLVETIQTFRERYMVEVPKGRASWALDTVTMEEAKEFSQKYLTETIVSHRTITEEEALELCDKDNDYCRKWSDEKKKEVFFTTIEEQKYEQVHTDK